MRDDCKHIFEPTQGYSGMPDFRMNRQMSNEPICHFKCNKCNARTFLTENQWDVHLTDTWDDR